MESFDVVVIGAGFAGLAAAKSYLQCAPDTKLLILDVYSTLGGTWAVQRIYPTLKSNNQLGTFELPDFPMHEGYGVKPGSHIPGMAVHRYLSDYADKFGLTERLRLNSKALSAEKLDDTTWKLHVQVSKTETEPEKEYYLNSKKLILATGLTSQAEKIHYDGQEEFGAPVLNSSVLATDCVRLTKMTPEEDRHITVLGGSKSAYDAVYMFANAGFDVNWIIRKSGYGPTWMAPSHIQAGPKSLWVEKVPCTRFFTWFSPCIWSGSDDTWIRRLLHGTIIGRLLVKLFWTKLGNDVIEQSGLNSDPELKKLIPDQSCLWYATSLAILNYERDIHDFVRNGQVKIYREDVDCLTLKTVNLANGTKLPSPAGLVTSTSWQHRPNIEFKPARMYEELGIPSSSYSDEQRQFWKALDQQADKEIFSRFPMLANAPQKAPELPSKNEPAADALTIEKKGPSEPFRLYRFLAPPGLTAKGDRSIVFQGYVANLLNQVRNEVTGLWSYAYLNDELDFTDKDVHWQAALGQRFCQRRYPYGYGSKYHDTVFEQIPYFDQLLSDLGLQHRRKGSWFKEAFEPYYQPDYRGITAEWLKKRSKA